MQVTDKESKPDLLRRLFFPSKQDHEDGVLKGVLQLNEKWFTEWALPTLDKVYPIGDGTVHWRRPGFLVHLSPEKYVDVYMNAKANAGMICPSWYVSHLSENIGRS
jgi:hypothetical protein